MPSNLTLASATNLPHASIACETSYDTRYGSWWPGNTFAFFSEPHWCRGTAPLHPERIPYFPANCMTPSPRQYPLSAYRSQIRSCNTATGQLRPASRLRVVESMRT